MKCVGCGLRHSIFALALSRCCVLTYCLHTVLDSSTSRAACIHATSRAMHIQRCPCVPIAECSAVLRWADRGRSGYNNNKMARSTSSSSFVLIVCLSALIVCLSARIFSFALIVCLIALIVCLIALITACTNLLSSLH